MTQPYYTIDFSASACMFEIRVNDYPVINMNIEGQIATNIPINFAILESGAQTISVTILPMLGETQLHPKTDLHFNIKLFDVTTDFVFQNQFGEYQSEPIDEKKKLPILKYNSIFQAEVPYKLEAWQNGINLKDVKNLREKVDKTYQYLSQLIQIGNFEEYKRIISKRENNMATSMYLSKEESERRMNGLIEDFKSGFKVMPIASDSILQIYGNNKVAVLKKLNGEPAFYLENNETEEELMLDIALYIPNGKDEFEVI
jgi:hypothetical protein